MAQSPTALRALAVSQSEGFRFTRSDGFFPLTRRCNLLSMNRGTPRKVLERARLQAF